MPTALQGEHFVHTCCYCGHSNTERRDKLLPFHFNGYRCTSCGRTLDDLDHGLLANNAKPPK